MNIVANEKGQFVLPQIPASISPALADLIAEYRVGFFASDEHLHERWSNAARLIHAFEPQSRADLVAKLIVAIHYRDPEMCGDALAIEAPQPAADRLAVEMELACLERLLICVAPAASQAAWDEAECALSKAHADMEALGTDFEDEDLDRLADVHSDAVDAILALPAETMVQAVRKLELAMFDANTVLSRADFPALLADAKRLALREA